MKWKKKEPAILPETASTIEIIAHKHASEEVKREAEEADQRLKKLLKDNHFTLKIYLAGGGKGKES